MADRASRQLPARARHGARALVVLLGLVLALIVPAAVMAASASGTASGAAERGKIDARPAAAMTGARASGERVVVVPAAGEATPAPGGSGESGGTETGGTEGGTSWVTETPTPAESLVPVLLGGVVLVILVVLMAMTSANPSKT